MEIQTSKIAKLIPKFYA
jgi:hypothetical protein